MLEHSPAAEKNTFQAFAGMEMAVLPLPTLFR
jgi:hypothetical protein